MGEFKTFSAVLEPSGYQIRVGGVRRSYVFQTYDSAFQAVQEERLDDYEIVPVDTIE